MPEQSCEMQTVDSDIEAEGGCGLYLEEESSQVADVDADNQGCSMEQVDQATQQESSSQLPPGLSDFMVDAAMFVADQMEAEAAAKAEAEAEAADAQVAEPEATITECELATIPVPEVATPEAEETPAEAACEIAPEIDDASTDTPVETNESEEIEETEETEESEESEEASDESQTESAGE